MYNFQCVRHAHQTVSCDNEEDIVNPWEKGHLECPSGTTVAVHDANIGRDDPDICSGTSGKYKACKIKPLQNYC